jgi:hypothetical protein
MFASRAFMALTCPAKPGEAAKRARYAQQSTALVPAVTEFPEPLRTRGSWTLGYNVEKGCHGFVR